MKIEHIGDESVKELLTGHFFKIPRFQRPYAWVAENVEEFWTDAISDNDLNYFIGSMVLFKNGDSLGIVDGQQRLTTIVMILCAIRDELTARGSDKLAAGLQKQIARRDFNDEERYVLDTETSYPYFQEHVLKGEPATVAADMHAEEKLIAETFNYLKQKISDAVGAIEHDPSVGASAKGKKIEKKLLDIRDKVLSLRAVAIQLENEEDASTIFETLNTRGKDLTVDQLIKTLFSRHIATKRSVDEVRIKWERIQTLLEESQSRIYIDTFLHHYWLSKWDYISKKRLYKFAKKRITSANAREHLNWMVEDSGIYRSLYESSFEKWNSNEHDIRRSIDAIGTFGLRQPFPLLLTLLRELRSGSLSANNVRSAFWAIECFHFMFTAIASKTSTGGMSKMYAVYAQRIHTASQQQKKVDEIRELRNKLKERLPTRDEFISGFQNLKFSRSFTKQKTLVRYVLSTMVGPTIAGIAVDYDKMTIEHIYPEKPRHGQPAMEEELVSSIGNLILLSGDANDKLANKSFEKKKDILTSMPTATREQLHELKRWGAEEITERTAKMAAVAYDKTWKF